VYRLQLKFSNPKNLKESLWLDWEILETPAAHLWIHMLLDLSRSKNTLYPRFTGFVSPHKTMKDLQERLNRSIEVINASGIYQIPERAQNSFTQEFGNVIHHHFELLSGSVDKPAHYVRWDTPQNVRNAIAELNHCIHDMEALHRSHEMHNQGFDSASALIVASRRAKRIYIPDEIFKYFTFDIEFGTIVYHYCQIGKTWWEVFLDKDEEIFDQAIIPLKYLSGEFDISFTKETIHGEVLEEFKNFLASRGLDPHDPKLALGYVPVGKLIRAPGMTDQDYKQALEQHLSLRRVKVFKNRELRAVMEVNYDEYNLGTGEVGR
jgi:hypothetical protein